MLRKAEKSADGHGMHWAHFSSDTVCSLGLGEPPKEAVHRVQGLVSSLQRCSRGQFIEHFFPDDAFVKQDVGEQPQHICREKTHISSDAVLFSIIYWTFTAVL